MNEISNLQKKPLKILKYVLISFFTWVIFVVVSVVGWFFLICLLFSPNDFNEYSEGARWNCDSDLFYSSYVPLYFEKIDELRNHYGIECSEIINQTDIEGDNIVEIFLYNEKFTIALLVAKRGYYGHYRLQLYYYDLQDAATRNNVVNFVNDLTQYAAYDTKSEESENYFEKLYSDCIENDVKGTSYKYHFDHMIGYVGYDVATETSMGGYYYMMQKNRDNEILSSFYGFEGILKALD